MRTALGSLLFALVALAAESLWPAILVHAFADLLSGDLGYRALNREPGGGRGAEAELSAT